MRKRALGLALIALLASAAPSSAQDTAPVPVPPPLPRRPPPTPEEVPEYRSIVPQGPDTPWGLSSELLDPLFGKAAVYAEYTQRFTCDETARTSDYDAEGNADGEDLRRYGYLFVKDAGALREYRQQLAKDGTLKPGAVNDADPFPPAYAWVFLFSRFNEPYFSYRYLGERFDGFDWVHEVQFKGSLPFTDGRDIRQWEGVILIDAVTYTPLEIRAEPSGQRERIEALYRQYMQSFNFMGLRTKPKPKGYRAQLEFRHRRDGLTFPTELRYDTFLAVSPTQVVPVQASVRTYSGYQIFQPNVREVPGKTVKSH